MPDFHHQHQQNRAQNHLQSTTLTTTSGLGSNFTSYTTDPIDSSLGSSNNSDHHHHHNRKNGRGAGTSTSFIESDIGTNDEYLFMPDSDHANLMSPHQQQRMMMNFDGGESDRFSLTLTSDESMREQKAFNFDFFFLFSSSYQVSTFHRNTLKQIHSYSVLRLMSIQAPIALLISVNMVTSIISSTTSRPYRPHLARQTERL